MNRQRPQVLHNGSGTSHAGKRTCLAISRMVRLALNSIFSAMRSRQSVSALSARNCKELAGRGGQAPAPSHSGQSNQQRASECIRDCGRVSRVGLRFCGLCDVARLLRGSVALRVARPPRQPKVGQPAARRPGRFPRLIECEPVRTCAGQSPGESSSTHRPAWSHLKALVSLGAGIFKIHPNPSESTARMCSAAPGQPQAICALTGAYAA